MKHGPAAGQPRPARRRFGSARTRRCAEDHVGATPPPRRLSAPAPRCACASANKESCEREARTDRKFDQLYDSLGYERAFSVEWEEWHRAGMPNPPGMPRRRHLTQPRSTTGATRASASERFAITCARTRRRRRFTLWSRPGRSRASCPRLMRPGMLAVPGAMRRPPASSAGRKKSRPSWGLEGRLRSRSSDLRKLGRTPKNVTPYFDQFDSGMCPTAKGSGTHASGERWHHYRRPGPISFPGRLAAHTAADRWIPRTICTPPAQRVTRRIRS
jgi:hypothetical protein